jgi:phytoene/squalene synthetase
MGAADGGERDAADWQPAERAAVKPTAASADVVVVAARAFERDRYLAALLAPVQARPALLTIAAFAGEVGRVPASVSDPMIGAIRLQWWRDAVAAMADPALLATGHPIADALGSAVRAHALPLALLTGYIDATEAGLAADPPDSDEALTAHLMATEGALFELALHILGGTAAVDRARPLAAAAQAYGLTRLLIELPAYTREGRTLIPAPMLAAAGISAADLYGGQPEVESRLAPIATALASEARRHLALARAAFRRKLRPADRAALLPLAVVMPNLQAWTRTPGGLLHRAVDVLPLTRVTRLAWTHVTGRL